MVTSFTFFESTKKTIISTVLIKTSELRTIVFEFFTMVPPNHRKLFVAVLYVVSCIVATFTLKQPISFSVTDNIIHHVTKPVENHLSAAKPKTHNSLRQQKKERVLDELQTINGQYTEEEMDNINELNEEYMIVMVFLRMMGYVLLSPFIIAGKILNCIYPMFFMTVHSLLWSVCVLFSDEDFCASGEDQGEDIGVIPYLMFFMSFYFRFNLEDLEFV